jgi:hypothetical protein
MNATIDMIAAIQQDRERSIGRDRLARLAAQARDCCRPSTIRRLVRTLRLPALSRQEPT